MQEHRGFWVLVTGTGRCGTGYISRVLTSAGVKCSHEGLFRTDSPEETLRRVIERHENAWWDWEAESSWLAAPHLEMPELDPVVVVHLVREPKKVIDSQMRIKAFEQPDSPFYLWQLRWLPELEEFNDQFHRAAYFYVRWNEMIEEAEPDIFWRIENNVCDLLEKLDIRHEGVELFDDKLYNSRGGYGPSDVDLNDLPGELRIPLKEMAERYNYDWAA